MKVRQFLENLFRGKGDTSMDTPDAIKQQDSIKNMLVMLEQTRETEYACDEVYQIIDQFAELVKRGEDAAQMMPMIQHHLDLCPDCREEYEALMRVLNAIPAGNA
jgi:hypothetical protein